MPDRHVEEPRPRLTRRSLLALAGSVGALVPVSAAIGLAHGDDEEQDDDPDNDGRGDDDDRHDDRSGSSDDDGKVAPQGTVPPGSAAVRIVDDDHDGFQPRTITVDPGQQVTFVNLDDDPHTATGIGFDTGVIDPGQQVTVAFDTPGSLPYSCRFHPIMTGQIDVRDATGSVPATPAASPAASPGASPVSSASAEVAIRDFTFSPPEIVVEAGTTITWRNEDAVPHTATSAEGAFDTGTIDAGADARETFDTSGRYPYLCAFHPAMTGTIVVR